MAVRRVRRILRRIDPWTVLKVSLVFNGIVALIFVLGTWVMWSLALRRGIPDRIVDVFESLTLTISVEGELYFRIVVLLAIIGAILMTGFMTLGAVLYNLIADLVGGVEIAVLEETYRPVATRTKIAPSSEVAGAASSQAGGDVAPDEGLPVPDVPEEGQPAAPEAVPATPEREIPAAARRLAGHDTDQRQPPAEDPAPPEEEIPRVRTG